MKKLNISYYLIVKWGANIIMKKANNKYTEEHIIVKTQGIISIIKIAKIKKLAKND